MSAAIEPEGLANPPVEIGGNRGRLLEAGREILACGDASLLQSGINPDRIARAAGVSRQTFYRHFPNKLDFLRSLADSLRTPASFLDLEEAMAWLIAQRTDDPKASIDRAFDGLWELLSSDFERQRALQTLFHLGGDDPEIREVARSDADARTNFFSTVWSRSLTELGMALHDEWSLADFIDIFDGVIAGALQRHTLDPDGAARMFRPALWVLFTVAVTPQAGERTIDLRFAVDRISTELSRRWTEERNASIREPEVLNVRQRLIESVRAVLEANGYHGTTVERIAAEAGVAESVVQAAGSVPALISMTISPTFSRLNRELSFDESAGSFSVDETIDRHLDRLRAAVAADRALFTAFSTVILDATPSAAVRSTRAHFQGPLVEFMVRNSAGHRGSAEQLLQRTIASAMFGWSEEPR